MDGRKRDERSKQDEGSQQDERIERLRERARKRWGRADDDVDDLVARLDADDPEERAEAVWSLAELATEDPDRSRSVPVKSELAPLLADDDKWVRRGASWAVAKVAEEYPRRGHAALSAVTETLSDDDRLVRENAVLAVAGVAEEYPHAAEPALAELADIADEEEGLARRYAAETLQRLVRRLAEDGFPETIETTPEVAEMLSGEGVVVAVTDDEDAPNVRVRGGASGPPRTDEGGDGPDADEPTDTRGPPDPVPSPPEIDADRGDFEPLREFATGPLTDAVKARAPAASDGGQPVVVVRRTLRADAGVVPSRVQPAIRAWAGVDDHPYVAAILARGSAPRPWFATEFMDGGNLRDRLGSIGFDRAMWYAHCVATAICHGHARGVVHGALRPGAVGLSQVLGAWSVPQVGEWAFGDLLAEVRETPVPPAYAAPEHLAPEEFGTPDSVTDVYQLGALCYALFAGRPPFTGEPSAVARRVVSEDPEPPSRHAEAVPEPIDELIGRALTKEKRARFETAEDFLRELEIVGRELPLSFEL
jgi:hypothetical protein